MASLSLLMPRSRIAVFTFAEGLLAALAHDLAIDVTVARGSGEPSGEGEGNASIALHVAGLRVAGAMKRGKLVPLPPADCAEIERRLREDVFGGALHVEVRGVAGTGKAQLHVAWAKGAQDVSCAVRVEREREATLVHGECALSLAALGIREVKAPLGAFRLRDRVVVRFDLVFGPSGEQAAEGVP